MSASLIEFLRGGERTSDFNRAIAIFEARQHAIFRRLDDRGDGNGTRHLQTDRSKILGFRKSMAA